jgi:ActR/RegA family two-component response regulator
LLFVDRAEADSIVAESRRTKSRAIESVFVDGVVRRLLDTLAHFEPDHRVVHARLSDMRALAKLVSVGAPMREFDQLLRRGRLGEAEKELDAVMENLGEGMSRLRMLADDVGRFAAAEASPPGPVRLSRELEAARDLLGHAFENRLSVEFVVDDLPAARAVRGPLLRGFCLLLLASLESFGPEEEGRVHIEGRAQAGFLSLEVRDNGAGYSSEVQTRIGDLDFLAAQPGYAPLFLGLAREAIRAAGGSLELGSAIGTGARVRVSFPTADQPAAPRPLEGPRPGLPVHGRILLVEEDLLLRRALERHLAEVFDVVALDSIATAVTEVQAQRYDVAVVSLPRPESFGLKLLTSLVEARAEPGRNCIVVVSPGVKHSTRERIVGLGAIVVTRPADFTTIRSICDRLIPGEVMVVADEHLAPVEGEGGEEDGDEPSGGVMPADEAPEEG